MTGRARIFADSNTSTLTSLSFSDQLAPPGLVLGPVVGARTPRPAQPASAPRGIPTRPRGPSHSFLVDRFSAGERSCPSLCIETQREIADRLATFGKRRLKLPVGRVGDADAWASVFDADKNESRLLHTHGDYSTGFPGEYVRTKSGATIYVESKVKEQARPDREPPDRWQFSYTTSIAFKGQPENEVVLDFNRGLGASAESEAPDVANVRRLDGARAMPDEWPSESHGKTRSRYPVDFKELGLKLMGERETAEPAPDLEPEARSLLLKRHSTPEIAAKINRSASQVRRLTGAMRLKRRKIRAVYGVAGLRLKSRRPNAEQLQAIELALSLIDSWAFNAQKDRRLREVGDAWIRGFEDPETVELYRAELVRLARSVRRVA